MIKANSLLYAVYICLIVSILCGALIYFAQLYNQLNVYYSSRESLYIENQSAVHFALEHIENRDSGWTEEVNGSASQSEIIPYGLLSLLEVNTFTQQDTIVSSYFIGQYASNETALYLTNFDRALSYAGKVILKGTMFLPSNFINEKYIKNEKNELLKEGKIERSTRFLPPVHSALEQNFKLTSNKRIELKSLEKINDSIYYNPFTKPVIEIDLDNYLLENIILKGNFILYSKDSIVVKKNAVLQDVILKASSITLADNFEGSIQVFATKRIEVGFGVKLNYPSALCLFNNSDQKTEIVVKENASIQGGVVLFGNSFSYIDENRIILGEDSLLIGDLYCSGKVNLQGRVYGSVYCNSIFHGVANSSSDNCLHNTEINIQKRPDYFVSLPLLKDERKAYGIIKKVF
jgi:hypothetical protein